MSLENIAVTSIPRTSPRTFKLLEKLGISTVYDLLRYIPVRYEDYRTYLPLGSLDTKKHSSTSDDSLISEPKFTVKGTIESLRQRKLRAGKSVQTAILADSTGRTTLTWFNQPFICKILREGMDIQCSGTTTSGTFTPEEYEICQEAPYIHTGRLVPVYPLTRGLSSRTLREKIALALTYYDKDICDPLPTDIRSTGAFMSTPDMYRQIHTPDTVALLEQARDRFAFDELFFAYLSSHILRTQWQTEKVTYPITVDNHMPALHRFIDQLPFTLTSAQQKVISEVIDDLGSSRPMNRLIQGDVGSGKTVVAACAAYMTHCNQYTTLFMAPTAILAQQHAESLNNIYIRTKIPNPPTISLVTGSQRTIDEPGSIIVGTHALIAKQRSFEKVGLVIVDEQHKFGVAQRAELKTKGLSPHLLSMTATPIPRTVVLTLHGELDMSIIDELPQGRLPVKTYVVPPSKREDSYAWITKILAETSSQAFIVCPLIDESDAESLRNTKAVIHEYERLSHLVFPSLRLGLLHGRMKQKEKDTVMNQFAQHEIDILVSTPVIEVGIDMPRATIIAVEGAERFGLAQLHQLRGRVGRSAMQSYCLLYTESTAPHIHERLRYFASHNNGMKLAEYDLIRRGGGTMFGLQQHGRQAFRIASFADTALVKKTRTIADLFLTSYGTNISTFPELQRQLNTYEQSSIARN